MIRDNMGNYMVFPIPPESAVILNDCSNAYYGYNWKLNTDLYKFGTVEEIYKKDPLGAKFIQMFSEDYRIFMRRSGNDDSEVRVYFLGTDKYSHKKWRYYGQSKDVICGLKTGRIQSCTIPNLQTGGSFHIFPTEEFYDTCIVPVATRFGFSEFFPHKQDGA